MPQRIKYYSGHISYRSRTLDRVALPSDDLRHINLVNDFRIHEFDYFCVDQFVYGRPGSRCLLSPIEFVQAGSGSCELRVHGGR